jgi:peptidyl-prolyl cis-trans isomerase B (cyclophilin B)
VSPSSREREREYARRRYEKWATKQAQRELQRRRMRRNALVAAAAVVGVLVVVVGVVAFTKRSGADPSGAAVATAPAASPSSSASPAVSPSASAAANPCPAPTVTPPATPQSFKDVPPKSLAAGKSWKLTLVTSCGTITAQLDGAKAPQATASAIFLAQKNFWAGTSCHRLTTQGIFVLQCGDPKGDGTGGPGYSFGPVENAPADGVYPPGTLAMARSNSPDSNGSQFFLVYKETKLPTDGGGYTVFGKVTSGLDVVTKVAGGGSDDANNPGDGAPLRKISIVSATVAPA